MKDGKNFSRTSKTPIWSQDTAESCLGGTAQEETRMMQDACSRSDSQQVYTLHPENHCSFYPSYGDYYYRGSKWSNESLDFQGSH